MADNDKHIEPSLVSENEEEIDLDLEKPQDSDNDDISFDDEDFSDNSDNDIDLGDFESDADESINSLKDDTADIDSDFNEKPLTQDGDLDNDFDKKSSIEDNDKIQENSSDNQGSPLDNLVKIQTDTITHLDKLISTSEKFLPDIVDIKNEISNIQKKLDDIETKIINIDENKITKEDSITSTSPDKEEVSIFSKSDAPTNDDEGLLKSSDSKTDETIKSFSESDSKTVSSKPEVETNKGEELDEDNSEEVKTKTVTQLTPLGSLVAIFFFIIFLIGLLAFVDKTSGLPNVGIIKILKPAFKLFEPFLFFL